MGVSRIIGTVPRLKKIKMTITEKVMEEAKNRTPEDIAVDLNKHIIPALYDFMVGRKSLESLDYLLRDVLKCDEWKARLGKLRFRIDKYNLDVQEYKGRYVIAEDRNAIFDTARDVLAMLDPNGFYGECKRHKLEFSVLGELVHHEVNEVLKKSLTAQSNKITSRTLYRFGNKGAQLAILVKAARQCERKMSNSRFILTPNETNPALINVWCEKNCERFITVV